MGNGKHIACRYFVDTIGGKREIENNIHTSFFLEDFCGIGHGNLSRTKCVENLGKRMRGTAIFRIFAFKRLLHGTPGQIY
jgi:hypothetical protein